jgi:hypothetical protein
MNAARPASPRRWHPAAPLLIAAAAIALTVIAAATLRPSDPPPSTPRRTATGTSFQVEIVKPRLSRPLFGLLPDELETLVGGSHPWFDDGSRGATVRRLSPAAIELAAEGWDLRIAADARGKITQETVVEFPIRLGDRHLRAQCRPADPATGEIRFVSGSPAGYSGSFRAELARCRNARSGKEMDWPPSPLLLRGTFAVGE